MKLNYHSDQDITIKGISKAYHICIALLPVLCLINVPGINISLGTVLLILFIPHALVAVFCCLNNGKPHISSFFFVVFYLYMIFRADGSVARIVLCIAAYINLLGVCCGSIKTERIRKIIETFAIINSVLIIIQILSYYGFHYRIQYISQTLIHREFKDSYVFRDLKGLYRPSALFLEPSHYAQYCCFALISVLFPNNQKVDLKKAAIIGMGCILTTSGMGIALTFGIFVWYIIFSRASKDVKLFNILKWVPAIAIVIVVLLQIPFFQTAVQRVFSSVEGYNAIRGRTGQWSRAIGSMKGRILWFGYGNSASYPYYLAGLADTIYKYGIVGVILQFLCFLYLMIKKVDNYVWCCCIVFILLFCFAHLTSFYVQVFYFGIVVADAIRSNKRVHFRVRRV